MTDKKNEPKQTQIWVAKRIKKGHNNRKLQTNTTETSVAKKEYSNYQQKVIKNYYENLDTIVLTRLQELVTDLYLAETPAKKKKLWQQVEKALDKLKIKPAVKARILETQDVKILAQNLNGWLK